ncbi:MAG: hypothetical protein U0V73_10985 [Acidimicrobiia bacterium]
MRDLAEGAHAEGWRDVDGVFADGQSGWLAIVRFDDTLFVARPGEERPLKSVELVELVPGSIAVREVRLRFQDRVVWTLSYSPLEPPCDENDPTPFAEPEDFDFGEYVRSLVLDRDRQAGVFRRGAS